MSGPIPLQVSHLNEFSSKIYKIVGLLGSRALLCARNSPSFVDAKPDASVIKNRICEWVKKELNGINLDAYPSDIAPTQLIDADLDPLVYSDYYQYLRTIAQLLAYILSQMALTLKAQALPPRRSLNAYIIGWLDSQIESFRN